MLKNNDNNNSINHYIYPIQGSEYQLTNLRVLRHECMRGLQSDQQDD